MLSMPGIVLSFVLNFFFAKIKGFVLIKLLLSKKKFIYIMAKDNCFPSSSVLENPFHVQSE